MNEDTDTALLIRACITQLIPDLSEESIHQRIKALRHLVKSPPLDSESQARLAAEALHVSMADRHVDSIASCNPEDSEAGLGSSSTQNLPTASVAGDPSASTALRCLSSSPRTPCHGPEEGGLSALEPMESIATDDAVDDTLPALEEPDVLSDLSLRSNRTVGTGEALSLINLLPNFRTAAILAMLIDPRFTRLCLVFGEDTASATELQRAPKRSDGVAGIVVRLDWPLNLFRSLSLIGRAVMVKRGPEDRGSFPSSTCRALDHAKEAFNPRLSRC